MKKLIFLLVLVFISSFAFAFTIVENGVAKATVVLPKDASAVDNYAKDELIKYVKEISGATLEVSDTPSGENNIFIGEKSLENFDWSSLKNDGIVIKCDDKNLYLAGVNSGTIYAVYTFLEEYFGVKYILPKEDYIPKKKTMTVGKIDYTFSSPFMMRESFFTLFMGDYPYSLKLKQNGQFSPVPNELGGHVVLNGFAHTFNTIINPDDYGKTHPEWFSLRDGKRMATRAGQLCFSNEEMCQEFIKNVLEIVKNNPDDKMFSCTQNDTYNYCECDKCKELTEKYGHSGAMLTLINRVADAVKAQYPDKYIETFAYQWTREAPKGGIVPRDNVIIRLCSIECDFGQDFNHKNNADFFKDFMDWKKICKGLYVWDYVSDFSDYIICHPNFQVLQPNMKIMAENNVVAVFEEGDYGNENSCLNHYKRYIIAKLTWDPYLNMEKETKDFFNAYYGPGAKDMLAFLNAIGKPFERDDSIKLLTFMHDCNYYNAKDWQTCFNALNAALKKTKGTKYYDRVYLDMCCFYAGIIHAPEEVRENVKNLPFTSDYEFMKKFTEFGPKNGVIKASEGRPFLDSIYVIQDSAKEGTKPAECEGLSDDEWIDLQEGNLTQIFPGYGWTEIREDPKASNGKALYMIPKVPDWYVQKTLSYLYMIPGVKTGDVYMVYRIEPGDKAENGFSCGLYNEEAKALASEAISSENASEYVTKKMGTIDFENTTNKTFLWFSGTNPNNTRGMYLDRVFIILNK